MTKGQKSDTYWFDQFFRMVWNAVISYINNGIGTSMFLLNSIFCYLSRSAWFHFKRPFSPNMEQYTYTSSFVIKFPCLFWTSRSKRVNVSQSLFPFFVYLFSGNSRAKETVAYKISLPFGLYASSESTIQFQGYERNDCVNLLRLLEICWSGNK